jgi:predicted amidohydrolase
LSQIVDPWGAVIAQCSRGEGLAVAEIDTDLISSVREQMPVQQHRRRDVYELLPK